MQKLTIDTGVQEFELPGGVLRFNPSDPNVYHRFLEAIKTVETVEQTMVEKAKELKEDNGAEVLALLSQADKDTKAALMDAFGSSNDFDKLLEGVNLMAVATNGERVITNLLDQLRPIIEQGAKSFYSDKANAAVAQAKANRAARRRAAKE